MNPKAIGIIWFVATVVGLSGVYLFVSKSASPAVSHAVMGFAIGLSCIWVVGLISLIIKKVFTKKAG